MATTKLNNGTRKNSVIGQMVRVDPDNSKNFIAVDLNILDVIGTVAEVRQPGNPVTINLINDFSQMEELINELAALLALIKAETDKIDNAETDGLLGIHDSLAYRVQEIEDHIHCWERWIGPAASASSTNHVADAIGGAHQSGLDPLGVTVGTVVTSFQFTSGTTKQWGSPIQIWGATDSALILPSGYQAKYDLHHIRFTAAQTDKHEWALCIGCGATMAAAVSAGRYTTKPFFVENASKTVADVSLWMKRCSAGELLWGQLMHITDDDAETLDCQFGIHGYPG